MRDQRIHLTFTLLIFLGANIAGGCVAPDQAMEAESIWPTERWLVSSPEEQQMDPGRLNDMMALIDERNAPIDSVLIVRNGYLVFEQYRNGYDEVSSHHLQSVTKSYTSTLVGVAIQEGFIHDLDQHLLDFYPDRMIANMDPRKEEIALRHLLTMSEGMDWHEVDLPYTHPDNSLGQMWKKDDVVQHVLDQPMIRQPGQAWNYNSGTSILLGNIVEQATGQSVLAFAREYLFNPLGIGDLYWAMADRDHYHTDGGLYMVPRDMARLGYLMLNDGVWEGKQILPPGWVSQASTAHYQTQGGFDYGYQWWVMPVNGIYAALGHYDQAIYVIPEAEMVVVFTANVPDEAIHPEDGLLLRHILGACNDLPDGFRQKTYSNNGFNLAYGAEFGLFERPHEGAGEISSDAGTVQLAFVSYPVEILTISWDENMFGEDPEGVLDQTLAAMPEEERRAFTLGETAQVTLEGQDIYVRSFTLTSEIIQFSGLVGVWECEGSDRNYVLSYLTDSESQSVDLESRFKELYRSFECQGMH